MEPGNEFCRGRSAVYFLGNLDPAVLREGEGSAVKELVVETAQGEAVVDGRRPSGLVPFDVRGFDPYQRVSKPGIEAADGTAITVGHQDMLPELRIALCRYRSMD